MKEKDDALLQAKADELKKHLCKVFIPRLSFRKPSNTSVVDEGDLKPASSPKSSKSTGKRKQKQSKRV